MKDLADWRTIMKIKGCTSCETRKKSHFRGLCLLCISCKRLYDQNRYRKDKVKIDAKNKIYYEQNKEKNISSKAIKQN